MTSGDERREVAERLRKCGAELSILGADCETAFRVIDKVIGCREEDSWERFLGRLADLIDPTCDFEESADNDEFAIRIVSGYICHSCGREAIVERTAGGWAEPPHYCPHCGTRLIERGE